MERVNRILLHPWYCYILQEIDEWERDRKFCGHGSAHLLDTARLAYLLDLEEDKGIPKELVYAAALLHDIGRAEQYKKGTPHEEAGIGIALEILGECGFGEEECEVIRYAIASHRSRKLAAREPLADLIYRADKKSRSCFFCPVEPECGWKAEKKNRTLTD